ncbi:MAG: Glu-tRNA(Gln) amidotransferase subunit GatE [Nitrososphaerales archaeon]
MSSFYKEIGLLVGLEIHQQLATKAKLFCDCKPIDEEHQTPKFERRLRPSQSELGQVDPAALFEFKKRKPFKYHAGAHSACLVEADEEPPHPINEEAVDTALIIALTLSSTPVDELHVMRKIVIDGSNTTGFQRTAIVALGGVLKTPIGEIPVQTVCLEEDAARLLNESEGVRNYGLDRLCVPLVEVALAPFTATPDEVQEVAYTLGRVMRSTGRVMRGLGTIRQDINISIQGGSVVEVKGVQNLELISKIVDFEAKRQHFLAKIAQTLQSRGVKVEEAVGEVKELNVVFKQSSSKIIKRVVDSGGSVIGVALRGFKGLLKLEEHPNIRLGKEFADLVRFYGVGGIFHSDELPAYGISEEEVKNVRVALNLRDEDAFIIVAGDKSTLEDVVAAIIERARAAVKGVPPETRGPTPEGTTRFIRPRPGPARMYPETDIPPLPISEERVERLRAVIPKPWDETIKEYASKYGLSLKLASQICDSEYLKLFELIIKETKVQPSFVAATLTETLVSLSRLGLKTENLSEQTIKEVFILVDKMEISKEGVPAILEKILRGEAKTPKEAAEQLGLTPFTEEEVKKRVKELVEKNKQLIRSRGQGAFSALMGELMRDLRGKVDGKRLSILLQEEIKQTIEEKSG